jgi:hypothetical protein
VAGDVAAELASQKIGWMMLLLAVLSLAGLFRITHSEVLRSAAEASREALRQTGALQIQSLTREIASVAAAGLTWVLLSLCTVMSSLFAVPLLDPRRTVLTFAQPLSRSDHALGLFTGVLGLAGLGSLVYAAVLWAGFRWLGLMVSPRFLLIPVPFVLAFAPLYCVVLLATLTFRSGLFAAICGLAALVGCASLGSLDAVSPGAEPSGWSLLYALTPKVSELARLAGRLGEGARLSPSPAVSTLLIDAALVLVLVTVARRREA